MLCCTCRDWSKVYLRKSTVVQEISRYERGIEGLSRLKRNIISCGELQRKPIIIMGHGVAKAAKYEP